MSVVDPYKLNFSNMLCNVMSLAPKQNPLEEFEFLRKHKEFHEPLIQLNKTKVIKYICLVYDKNSPLHDVYPDLNKKKIIACELATFVKEENGQFNGKVEDMIRCDSTTETGKRINAMIIRYVTGMKSALYQKWVLYSELHTRESLKLLNGESKIDNFKKISEELEECESQLLSNDNLLHEDLTKYYFEDKLELRPEDIALKIAEGKEPIKLESVEEEY